MVTEIFVEVRSNYGCRAIYPLCTTSNRLALPALHCNRLAAWLVIGR
jgi:hypothetical protein